MSFQPVIPEGAHLGNSQDNPDAYSGLLFDDESGKLIGHASWVWTDDDDDDDFSYAGGSGYSPYGPGSAAGQDSDVRPLTEEEMEIALQFVTLVAVAVAEASIRLAPHVKRFWISTVKPTAIRVWIKLKSIARPRPAIEVDDEFEALVDDPLEDSSSSPRTTEIIVFEEPFTISESEWQIRYDAMIAAARFSEEQRRILASAKIVSDKPKDTLLRGQKSLTPREFAQRVLPTIVANPDLLKPETLQLLAASTDSAHVSKQKVLVRRRQR